jgi:hypothetical protein
MMRRECECWPLKNRTCKTGCGLVLVQMEDGRLLYLCTIHLRNLLPQSEEVNAANFRRFAGVSNYFRILPDGTRPIDG